VSSLFCCSRKLNFASLSCSSCSSLRICRRARHHRDQHAHGRKKQRVICSLKLFNTQPRTGGTMGLRRSRATHNRCVAVQLFLTFDESQARGRLWGAFCCFSAFPGLLLAASVRCSTGVGARVARWYAIGGAPAVDAASGNCCDTCGFRYPARPCGKASGKLAATLDGGTGCAVQRLRSLAMLWISSPSDRTSTSNCWKLSSTSASMVGSYKGCCCSVDCCTTCSASLCC
jgi:hypothetical protein